MCENTQITINFISLLYEETNKNKKEKTKSIFMTYMGWYFVLLFQFSWSSLCLMLIHSNLVFDIDLMKQVYVLFSYLVPEQSFCNKTFLI